MHKRLITTWDFFDGKKIETRVTPISETGHNVTPEQIVKDLKSQDLVTQFAAIQVARSILCVEHPPVAAWLLAGLLPPLLAALDRNCPQLQYTALGLLSNVAFSSSEHTETIANSGAISKLISFLATEDDRSERAVTMLGNFALHEAVEWRDEAMRELPAAILPYLHTHTPLRKLKLFIRTYSIFCRSCEDDEIKLEFSVTTLPHIHDLLDIEASGSLDVDDLGAFLIAQDIIVDACAALANIMLGSDECIEAVQAVPGLTARLVALLAHETPIVQGAALSAVGNMLAGTDDQVERCLEANCLEHITSLLQSGTSSLVAEAARAAGNIFAGTRTQTQRALEQGVLTLLPNILASEDTESRKQVVYAVTNLSCHASAVQHEMLLASGVLVPYCALLPHHDLAEDILNGLHGLIQVAEKDGDLKKLYYMLDAFDVLDHLEMLEEQEFQDDCCKIANMKANIRKHAREERFIVENEEAFTAQKIVQGLKSHHPETLSRAVSATYSIFHEQYPPVNALIEAGIVETLVKGLEPFTHTGLHMLSVWALSKITEENRNYRTAIINNGGIPKLLSLLSGGDEIALLASYSLGQLALHGPEVRHAVLDLATSEQRLKDLRAFVQTYEYSCSLFANDFDSIARLELEHLPRALPFVSVLLDIGDDEITLKVCWACSQLMENPYIPDLMVEVVQAVPRLTELLIAQVSHDAADVREAAMTAVVNMLAGTDTQTGRCLEAGCLDSILDLLHASDAGLVKLAAKASRNILGPAQSHIQLALDKGILTPLRQILASNDARSHVEVSRAIFNLCRYGSTRQRAHVLSSGVLEPFCALLAAPALDLDVADDILNSLLQLLQDTANVDEKQIKALCLKLDLIGVIETLQQLQELDSIDKNFYLKTLRVNALLRQQAREEHIVIEGGKLFTPTDIVQDLGSEDLTTQTRAAAAARSMTSRDDLSRIAAVDAGVLTLLVAALGRNDCIDLQCSAAAVLGNVTAGLYKHRMAVVNNGAIPKLVALLSHGGEPAAEAARTLGNLCWRAPAMRDLVLGRGAVTAILPHLRPDTPLDLLTKCTEAFAKLCSVIVSTTLIELVSPALPYLSKLLLVENEEVLKSACKALGNIMHTMQEAVEAVQAVDGLTERLVSLLGHEDTTVKEQALYAVVKMLTGTAKQADRCFEAGFVEHIESLLQSEETSLLEQAVLAITNICVHTDTQIQRALKKDILSPIVKIVADTEPNSFLQYCAVAALQNMTLKGTREQIMAVVDNGAIAVLVDVLYHGAAVAERAAYALVNISKTGPETKDLVLAHGAVRAVLSNVRRDSPIDLLRSYVALYESVSTDITTVSKFELVFGGLPHILQLIEPEDQDAGVMVYAVKVFINLMSGPDEIEAIQAVPVCVARIMCLLGHRMITVKITAWNFFLVMLQGNQFQIDRCVAAGCLDQFLSVLLRCQTIRLEEISSALIIMQRYNRHFKKHHKGSTLASLLKMMTDASDSCIPFFALSGLVHITSRGSIEHRMALVDTRLTSRLSRFLSQEIPVAEYAVVALGNIAGVSSEARDLVLAHGVMEDLLPLLHPETPLELLRKAAWAYRNICSSIPYDEPVDHLDLLSPCLPHLAELLNGRDEEVRRHICWAMVSLSKTHEGREVVQADPGLTARLLTLLGHGTAPVKKIVINYVLLVLSGTDAQATRCIEADCVDHILRYFRSRESALVTPAAAATRRIFGEDPRVLRALREDVLTPFMIILDYEPEGRTKVVQAVTNLWRLTSASERARILYSGILEPYCALLTTPDHTLTMDVLKSLEVLVQIAASDDIMKSFCVKLDEIGVLGQMKQLRGHEHEEINHTVRRLLRTYFSKV